MAAIGTDKALIERFGSSAFHKGSHPDYTKLMGQRINVIANLYKGRKISSAQAHNLVVGQIKKARLSIKMNGGAINDIKW